MQSPGLIRSGQGAKECHMLAYLEYNLFCIQTDNWIPLHTRTGKFPYTAISWHKEMEGFRNSPDATLIV